MTDAERIQMIRELVDNMNKKGQRPNGLEVQDYAYFLEDVETALADVIVVDFGEFVGS